tara:strand:+ start:1836 stop:4481 length:2646 start_codon:yes stop_codon:yes gene_type:complete
MAVFTAIATAIVSAIGISTAAIFGTLTWAGLATSIVAGGLAMGTAKVLGVFKPPNVASAKDPGVKVQVAPSTDNKVPVFYGTNLSGGIIVDAGISNQNDTMTYAIVLGEQTDTGTFSIGDQYRGDQKLNFGVAGSSHIVTSVTDANATSTNNVNGKMRCRVYAGGTAATDQIFPVNVANRVAATTMLSTITATTSYEGLIFAVFQLDYDPEEGLTGLGQYTAEITNSLSEPGAVLSDYLLNARYGAGLTTAELDTTSIAAVTAYATEQVDFTNTVGTTAQHDRWAINGMMGTYTNVFTNIDLICQACSTFFTYNPKIGKFQLVPNRTATSAEKSAAYIFDDDNVVGAIDVTSTQLYAQYNAIEAEFPDGAERDQTVTVNIATPPAELNSNEPVNKLTTRYPIVNDPARVTNLAQIDLRQSRKDLVVQLEADYAAIQTDVGDIVKLTNATYGFTNKLFRVMRVTEQEEQDGMLTVSLVLLEYADTVYTHIVVQASGTLDLTGIPGWWTGQWGNIDYANIGNVIGNVTIVDDPQGNVANVLIPGNGTVVGNVDIGNVIYGPGGPINFPNINFPVTIPNIPDIDKILANIDLGIGGEAGGYESNPTVITPGPGRTTFTPGEVINVTVPQPELRPADRTFPIGPMDIDLSGLLGIDFQNAVGQRTNTATSATIPLRPRGGITRANLGSVQAGLQYEEVVANNSVANSQVVDATLGTPASVISPIDIVDLGGIDYGEFSAINSMVPYGQLPSAGGALAYQPARKINYSAFNISAAGKYSPAGLSVFETVAGSGVVSTGLTSIPTLTDDFKYTISEDQGSTIAVTNGYPAASATRAYVPTTMEVINYANSDLESAGGATRAIDVTNLDKRISKSDFYLDLGDFFSGL